MTGVEKLLTSLFIQKFLAIQNTGFVLKIVKEISEFGLKKCVLVDQVVLAIKHYRDYGETIKTATPFPLRKNLGEQSEQSRTNIKGDIF